MTKVNKSIVKLEQTLNIVKIIRNLQYVTTLAKTKFIDEKDMFMIEHN